MLRLLWLAPERTDPEESFPALLGRRPAPEPLTFSEMTPQTLERLQPDVILVDGRANSVDAAAVIRKLRTDSDASFVVVLNEEDLAAFDFGCGVDDFVSDQATRAEFDTRLRRIGEDSQPDPSQVIRRGEISINRERFEVKARGEILDLTYKEFELFSYLATRPGKVCSRSMLLSEVWGYDFFGGTRTVDVHVRRLRAKLGQDSGVIETVRNVGYRFAG